MYRRKWDAKTKAIIVLWGGDMTKVPVAGFELISLVVVLDWYTKMSVGPCAGMQGKALLWLTALDLAVNRQFLNGVQVRKVRRRIDG